jgi:hypothetical protein
MIINSKTVFKISLFGWELAIIRYPKRKRYEGERNQGIQPDGAYIMQEGNFLFACDKEGNRINVQRSLTINDGVDGPSTVTVEYFFAGIYEEQKPVV